MLMLDDNAPAIVAPSGELRRWSQAEHLHEAAELSDKKQTQFQHAIRARKKKKKTSERR